MSLEEDKCKEELKWHKEKKKCTNYITISKLKKNKSKESFSSGLREQEILEKNTVSKEPSINQRWPFLSTEENKLLI